MVVAHGCVAAADVGRRWRARAARALREPNATPAAPTRRVRFGVSTLLIRVALAQWRGSTAPASRPRLSSPVGRVVRRRAVACSTLRATAARLRRDRPRAHCSRRLARSAPAHAPRPPRSTWTSLPAVPALARFAPRGRLDDAARDRFGRPRRHQRQHRAICGARHDFGSTRATTRAARPDAPSPHLLGVICARVARAAPRDLAHAAAGAEIRSRPIIAAHSPGGWRDAPRCVRDDARGRPRLDAVERGSPRRDVRAESRSAGSP